MKNKKEITEVKQTNLTEDAIAYADRILIDAVKQIDKDDLEKKIILPVSIMVENEDTWYYIYLSVLTEAPNGEEITNIKLTEKGKEIVEKIKNRKKGE